MALRVVGQQLLAAQAATQILGQGLGHAHGKHTGFFQRAFHKRGDVAGRKDQGVVERLQLGVHQDEALFVERQARAFQPGGATGLGDPQGVVGIKSAAIARVQAARRDLDHFGLRVDSDIARLQNTRKAGSNPRVMGGQNRLTRRQQHKLKVFGIAAQRFEFVAQAVLHGQHQLHTACARAHHGYRHAAPVDWPLAGFVEQSQPALVELRNRLDRHGQRLGTRHMAHLRC